MIITNFKTYESATGQAALDLAKVHEEVAQETGADIRICAQPVDLALLARTVKIPVYAQHIDPVGFGSNTGHILPESIKNDFLCDHRVTRARTQKCPTTGRAFLF